jgi:hypothetical protein
VTLPPHEQAVLDRLEKNGNPLGWKPWKRDERGQAVMRTVLSGPAGVRRICTFTITEKGLVNHAPRKIHAA